MSRDSHLHVLAALVLALDLGQNTGWALRTDCSRYSDMALLNQWLLP